MLHHINNYTKMGRELIVVLTGRFWNGAFCVPSGSTIRLIGRSIAAPI
jgi:hypothetical protein